MFLVGEEGWGYPGFLLSDSLPFTCNGLHPPPHFPDSPSSADTPHYRTRNRNRNTNPTKQIGYYVYLYSNNEIHKPLSYIPGVHDIYIQICINYPGIRYIRILVAERGRRGGGRVGGGRVRGGVYGGGFTYVKHSGQVLSLHLICFYTPSSLSYNHTTNHT